MPKRKVYKRDSQGRFAPTGKSGKKGRKAKALTDIGVTVRYEGMEVKYLNQRGRKDKAWRRVERANALHKAVTGKDHYNFNFMRGSRKLRKELGRS